MGTPSIPPVRTFLASDGILIAYREWGSGNRRVVLQHGFASDSLSEWHEPGVIDVLVRSGYRVLTVDARGHGASEAPHDPAYYGVPRIAQDLRELIDASSATQVDLVGYSMGAIAAIRATIDAPERVRRLVIGGIGSSAAELGGVDTRVLDTRLLAEAFLTEDPATIGDPGLAGWRASVDAAGADHRAIGAVAMALRPENLELERISAATLIIAGAEDPFSSHPEVLHARFPNALLRVLPGDHSSARHEPNFSREIRNFLAS